MMATRGNGPTSRDSENPTPSARGRPRGPRGNAHIPQTFQASSSNPTTPAIRNAANNVSPPLRCFVQSITNV